MKQILMTIALLAAPAAIQAQQREVQSLNFGWAFSRDSLMTDARRVDVPHDFQIEQPWVAPSVDERADNSDAAANIKSRLSARGFKEMGTGWYQRTITHHPLPNTRTLLDFEGIMLVGDVYLNGRRVGGTDYGYVGFQVDVTNQLHEGDNTLVVKASTMTEKNSRWYTGGGLFRNVSLITTPADLYLERHPLYITTRDNRYVNVRVELTNRTKQKTVRMKLRIYSPDGQLVYENTEARKRVSPSRTMEARLTEAEITDPQLWETEHPNLYRAVVTLLRDDGSVADETEEHFGIRTVEIAPDYGLKVNGQKVLLKGIANHHTLGALGAAAYPRAIEKRLQLLKAFGVNHVRTSHNPYSRQFIELCDKYGILVVDELYDKWTRQHTGGRATWESHWQYDVPEWVKRDRNSPSVVLWSFGNELQQDPNQAFNDFGVTAYALQKTLLLRYDSTRLTTVAMHPRYRNWLTDSLPCDLALKTDVQAYNYRYMYFPGDGRRFPWMTFYQSEASVSNMGPNWWEMNLNRVMGLAYWGAIDYLGESQGWPAKGWSQGVFYIDLEPKPKAYLMKSLFTEEPMVHIGIIEDGTVDMVWNGVQTGNQQMSENWNRQENTVVSLYTYTNADEVELRLNGRSLGRRVNPIDPKRRNQIRWDSIPYRKGRLEAIAYVKRNGRSVVTATHAVETTGKAVRLVATPDNATWKADGQDLQHVRLTAVDSKGRRVWAANDELVFSVEGGACIVAVTNGDSTSDELNAAPDFDTSKTVTAHRRLWNGSAMVILRSGREPAAVTLTTKAPSYKPVITKLTTN